jgi:hypothetical protein
MTRAARMVKRVALGIEISGDRSHTTIVRAMSAWASSWSTCSPT